MDLQSFINMIKEEILPLMIFRWGYHETPEMSLRQ